MHLISFVNESFSSINGHEWVIVVISIHFHPFSSIFHGHVKLLGGIDPVNAAMVVQMPALSCDFNHTITRSWRFDTSFVPVSRFLAQLGQGDLTPMGRER